MLHKDIRETTDLKRVVLRILFWRQLNGRFAGRQKQRVAFGTREELNTFVCLAWLSSKRKGRLP